MTTHYVDGAGYNGRYSAHAIVTGEEVEEVILRVSHKEYTNNEMEYAALYHCLNRFAQAGDTIYTDSELIVRQISGEYNIKAQNLIPLYDKCTALLHNKHIEIKWIPRNRNLAGKILEQIKRIKWNQTS